MIKHIIDVHELSLRGRMRAWLQTVLDQSQILYETLLTLKMTLQNQTFYFFSINCENNTFCIENVLWMKYISRWLKIDFEKCTELFTSTIGSM